MVLINLHVGLLQDADPEFIAVVRVRAQQLSMVPHWQPIVNDNLPTTAVQVKTDQILPIGVDDGVTASVLRV